MNIVQTAQVHMHFDLIDLQAVASHGMPLST
jgi:hypothetical protein